MKQEIRVVVGYTGEIESKTQDALQELNSAGYKVVNTSSSMVMEHSFPKITLILLAEKKEANPPEFLV